MTDQRKDLPPANSPQFLERVREAMSTYLGNRGDQLDRGVTLRDLYESGIVSLSGSSLTGSGKASIAGVGTKVAPKTGVDLTPPPTPTGFKVSAAITTVFIGCDAQLYTQGGGHDRTVVYGATYTTGPLPVFADAIKITEFVGTVFGHPSNPATKWRLWIKWQSIDGVLSVVPAGGTNGLEAITGQDVGLLLEALQGRLTESQLYIDLGRRINLIDGVEVGSVAKRLEAQYGTVTNEYLASIGASATEVTRKYTLADGTVLTTAASDVRSYAYSKLSVDGAISASGNSLTQNFTVADGTVLTSANQYTNNYTYSKASADGLITAAGDSLTQKFTLADGVVVNTASNDVRNFTFSKASITGAINLAGSDLTSTFNTKIGDALVTADASVKNYAYSKASTDGAIATSANILIAKQDTTNANVTEISTSRIGYATKNGLVFDGDNATEVYPAYLYPDATFPVYAVRRRLIIDKFGVAGWNAAKPSEPVVWNAGLPLATAIKQVSVTDGTGNMVGIEQAFSAQKTLNDGLRAQYSVKIDQNGYVSGFGLSSSLRTGVPESAFVVRADSFSIASPEGTGIAPTNPFTVQTTPTVINGLPVAAGVYIKTALIANGTITNAKIADAAIDDAKIERLSASKLTAGQIRVGEFITSGNYIAGSQGWAINGSGGAEFLNVRVRGEVNATSGTFAGSLSAATGTFAGVLSAQAINAVDTINIAGNAVTVPLSSAGGYSASVSLNVSTLTTFHLTATWVQGTGRNSSFVRLKHGGNWLNSQSPIEGTIGTLTAQVQALGFTTFSIEADNPVGQMSCSIIVMGVRR